MEALKLADAAQAAKVHDIMVAQLRRLENVA